MNELAENLQREAAALHGQGRRREAIDAYRQLLEIDPDLTDCWYELGFLLKAEGQYDAALAAYGEALARGVRNPEEVHLNRAVIYADHLRRDDAAERELRAALIIDPDYLPAMLNLGNLHEQRGRRDEALAHYDGVLAAEYASPRNDDRASALRAEALARIAQLRPPESPDDPLLGRMRAAAADVALDRVTRANLLYTTGRACDHLGLHDEAFAAFAEANRHVRHAGPAYSRIQARRFTDGLIQAFPQATSADRPGDDPGEPAPLFICGMFRSGATLVEQLLAAHPGVAAGGEVDFLPRLVRGPLHPFPASMRALDAQRLDALARDYRAYLAELFPEARQRSTFVTDRRPDNFLLLGLIKKLFPDAKIIHTVRAPLDNCFSIFMQHFDPRVVRYATDLGDIGHFYGQYRRVMAHWKQLYGDSILDFDYDAFVREPRPQLVRLLEFLGLEWDARCLEFHELDGTATTAGDRRGRRPLYDEAPGRWRNYAAHLEPLAAALRDAGVEVEQPRG